MRDFFQQWWPILIPAVLDWIWDKTAARRERKARDAGVAVIRNSLEGMSEQGQTIVKKIDQGMAELAVTTGRWSKKRWTSPPSIGGKRRATSENGTDE